MTPACKLETPNQHRVLAASGVRQRAAILIQKRSVFLTQQRGVILSEAKDLSL
jgi:hypothetical protein